MPGPPALADAPGAGGDPPGLTESTRKDIEVPVGDAGCLGSGTAAITRGKVTAGIAARAAEGLGVGGRVNMVTGDLGRGGGITTLTASAATVCITAVAAVGFCRGIDGTGIGGLGITRGIGAVATLAAGESIAAAATISYTTFDQINAVFGNGLSALGAAALAALAAVRVAAAAPGGELYQVKSAQGLGVDGIGEAYRAAVAAVAAAVGRTASASGDRAFDV